ncbi:MAG: tRNA (adenosine(37)-N6)-dimethylallyltransferase MiaA, partial [Candidatus Eremiobacteraeota bacterium]|nr:tRNA (adenosine(37)-N6)-dimethylallyltransferase MiaA [Candidatus Eremiobacteraeota bacterium]
SIKVFLDVDASELESRIERRTDAMLEAGIVEEAERIGPDAIAASAVGYPQALAFLRGWCTKQELRALLVRATRRYAKRQRLWFRSEPNVHRLAPADVARTAKELLEWA